MTTKVVHCKKEPYDVYIGRPSKWGNPFPIRLSMLHGLKEYDYEREESLRLYKEYIMSKPELLADIHELKGKVLGCWCKPKDCHGDILAEVADAH